jgi:hypothetical protein
MWMTSTLAKNKCRVKTRISVVLPVDDRVSRVIDMKFLLLIGGNRDEWAKLTPEDWTQSEGVHGTLIAALKQSGEFIECNELGVTPETARVIRTIGGAPASTDGPLYDSDDFASGYYLVDCVDIDRASEIAAELYESSFCPIEVRLAGGE